MRQTQPLVDPDDRSASLMLHTGTITLRDNGKGISIQLYQDIPEKKFDILLKGTHESELRLLSEI